MKHLLILIAVLACSAAIAAPTLVAAPYAVGPDQPETASLSVDGGAPIACTLKLAAGGTLQPMCDLASITAPGTYKLVLSVSNKSTLINETGGGTYVAGGTTEAAPFMYVFRRGVAAPPVPKLAP